MVPFHREVCFVCGMSPRGSRGPSVSYDCLRVYDGSAPRNPQPGLISWIPSYDGARAIIAMRNATEPILHLVNPNTLPFRTLLEPIARAMGVTLVPYDRWLSRLQESLNDTSVSEVEHMKRNPALRLLDYYRSRWSNDGRDAILDTAKAVRIAPSMLDMRLPAEFVDRWLVSWRKSGFLPVA